MKFQTVKWAVVGCALSLPAFAQQGGQMGQHQMPGSQTPSSKMQMGEQNIGMPLPKDEKGFLTHMYMDNRHEIEMAQLAVQKASNPQVKQFAQKLVQDHQK